VPIERPFPVAIDVVVLLMAVIGGRVIPAFTASALPRAKLRRHVVLDRAVLVATGLLLLADLLALSDAPMAALLLATAALHGARAAGWAPFATRGRPILWILHLSYAWIPLGLVLRACARLESGVPEALGLHAIALGAAGGLILGMMTRTARGHTGQPLQAGRAEIAAYGLVHLAAVARVFGPLLLPGLTETWLIAASAAWSGAFLLYAGRFLPVLCRPRIDGRPG
jgi:uncharacterized protein involved in response to NO